MSMREAAELIAVGIDGSRSVYVRNDKGHFPAVPTRVEAPAVVIDERTRLAICAAHHLSGAVTELLRFASEGDTAPSRPGSYRFALEPETLEQIADGLKMAIEIEAPAIEERGDREGAELTGQLAGAVIRFLEGWA